jgi:hypothetical protein
VIAYVTIERRGGNSGPYDLVVTVGHNAHNHVRLTDEEARDLLNAGVPEQSSL